MDFNELHLRELFSKLFSPNGQEPSLTNSVGNSPWMMNLDGSDSSQQSQPMNQMDEYAQLQKLFPMQHDASDRLKNTLDTTPNRADYQPSGFNKVLASIAGMSAGGPAAYHDGAALGFKNNPEEQMKVTHGIIDEPYNKAVSDWSLKLKPEQELAQAERGENTNMRIAGNNYLQNDRYNKRTDYMANKATEDQRLKQEQIDINKFRADAYSYRAMHPDMEGKVDENGQLVYIDKKDPTKQVWTGLTLPAKMSDHDRIELGISGRLSEIAAQGRVQSGLETQKETNRETLEDKRIQGRLDLYNDQVTNPKPGSAGDPNKITTSTKTMMEGARMLLPHIPEIDQQAAGLEKVGLFGPIMSRIRGYAEKVGTTGSAEEVQASLEQFANVIAKDPELNRDAAVGQFATTLGLLASGAGRVHGGARGGGSIEMVRYMKSLLSSDSTYPMFKGRLAALNSYMKTYAEGPKAPETPKSNPTLDSALDKIFGAKK
jgi:hypothetical protein